MSHATCLDFFGLFCVKIKGHTERYIWPDDQFKIVLCIKAET